MTIETAARYNRSYFEGIPLKELISWLNDKRDDYHNGVASVSDAIFDMAEDVLKVRSPKNKYFNQVGSSVRGKKEKLVIPLGSLSKIKDDKLQTWLDKAGDTVIVSDKIDGASSLYSTIDDEERLQSRGDGVKGQNLSSLIPIVKGIGRLRNGEAVRGELVMFNKDFTGLLAKQFENTRNLVSGVVNSKDRSKHKASSKIRFVAHEMMRPSKSLDKSGPYLEKRGFEVVHYRTFKNPSVADISKHFQLRKKKAPYEIDGLVLYSSKAGTIAYKVEGDVAETVVKDIVWELTRYGTYAPTISLKPIRLVGVTIKSASGYNARYLQDMGIGPGSVVTVIRANDVIPKIVSVTKKAKMKWPDSEYEWDANKVNIRIPDNVEEPEKIVVDRLTHGLVKLDIPNVRSGLVKKLVSNEIDTLLELFRCTRKDLVDSGLGDTQARNLYRDMQNSLKRVQHPTMMAASGLFAKGLGETRFDDVFAVYTYQQLTKLKPRQVMTTVSNLHGWSDKTALLFAKGFVKYKEFVKNLGWKPVKVVLSSKDKLTGKSIGFTGFRNKQLENVIKARGGKVTSSLTKATNILLVPNKSHQSVKVDKAIKNDIRVLALQDFLSEYKIKL